MSSETKKRTELEVVYVLFLDIVGYSKRAINEQRAAIFPAVLREKIPIDARFSKTL